MAGTSLTSSRATNHPRKREIVSAGLSLLVLCPVQDDYRMTYMYIGLLACWLIGLLACMFQEPAPERRGGGFQELAPERRGGLFAYWLIG